VTAQFLTQYLVLDDERVMSVLTTPLCQRLSAAAKSAPGRLALHHPATLAGATPKVSKP
jgi:hypothetical protein